MPVVVENGDEPRPALLKMLAFPRRNNTAGFARFYLSHLFLLHQVKRARVRLLQPVEVVVHSPLAIHYVDNIGISRLGGLVGLQISDVIVSSDAAESHLGCMHNLPVYEQQRAFGHLQRYKISLVVLDGWRWGGKS